MNVEIGNLMMELAKDERVEVGGENSLWEENVSFQGDIASNWSAEKYFPCYAHTPLNCKGIQECLGFQIPIQGFQIPGTECKSLMVEVGFRTPIVSEMPDSKGHDSGFQRQNFSGFRIPRAKLLRLLNPNSPYMGWSVPGVKRTGDSGTCGTCRRHITRLEPLPANDIARRSATLYSKSRPC